MTTRMASGNPPSRERSGARVEPPIHCSDRPQTHRRDDSDLKTFGQSMAHVDLSTGIVENRPAPLDWVRKYIGALGLGVPYVLEAGPEVDPSPPMTCFASSTLRCPNPRPA
jgi:hypothetical protein